MFIIVWQVAGPGPVHDWVVAHADDDAAGERNPLFRSPSTFKPLTKILLIAGAVLMLMAVIAVAANTPIERSKGSMLGSTAELSPVDVGHRRTAGSSWLASIHDRVTAIA